MPILLSIVAVVFISLFLLIRYLEGTSVFFPSKIIDLTPAQAGLPYEDLYLKTADGLTINAWLIKSNSEAATVIFAHGNAGTMSGRIMRVKFLHDLGLNVLIFDYRGYGKSQGSPSEKGIYLDAQAAYDYLKARTDINSERIIAYGASLGGVVMIDLATHRKVAALIVESSFSSAADMARRLYPVLPTFMMSIKFDSMAKIAKVDAPKLFLHSPDDHTVPFSMGQKLYAKATGTKEFLIIPGGHNDGALMTDPAVQAGFKQFLTTQALLEK